MPPIGALTSGANFKDKAWQITMADLPPVKVGYGAFINNVISFLIIALSVFILVKAMNAAESKLSLGLQPDAPPPPEDILLLREIRDELKKK